MNKYKQIKYRVIIWNLVRFIKLFFANYHSKIKNPPFFILGSGRNGSTLLSSILNAHPELFIPSEQFILPYTIMRRYIFWFKFRS